jgi:EAL domain-containing protein (putative c-di-GMP-specific phosphodiesterase class I)
MADRKTARAALGRAEEKRNLLLVWQPIHDARTREIYSAEALLRQRRHGGEIREASAVAEGAELGPELFAFDSWALRTAFREAARWPFHINVNLSPREFEGARLVPRLLSIAGAEGIDLRRINLEITETSTIKNPDETIDTLAELKSHGVGLWLDDFGTGHSSIEHLQRFPIDGLKLPAAFVKGLAGDDRSRSITRALIALAHELKLRVIAEGVEHEDQLRMLIDFQCEFIQGFLFSKPMTAEELTRSSSRISILPEREGRGARRDPSSRPS